MKLEIRVRDGENEWRHILCFDKAQNDKTMTNMIISLFNTFVAPKGEVCGV